MSNSSGINPDDFKINGISERDFETTRIQLLATPGVQNDNKTFSAHGLELNTSDRVLRGEIPWNDYSEKQYIAILAIALRKFYALQQREILNELYDVDEIKQFSVETKFHTGVPLTAVYNGLIRSEPYGSTFFCSYSSADNINSSPEYQGIRTGENSLIRNSNMIPTNAFGINELRGIIGPMEFLVLCIDNNSLYLRRIEKNGFIGLELSLYWNYANLRPDLFTRMYQD